MAHRKLVIGSSLLLTLAPSLGFAADEKFSIPGTSVTASSDDGNLPAYTVDGDLTTRWSAEGDGQWIRFDLGANKKVAYVKIAFLNGASRTFTFDIQTSTDGTTFSTVRSNVTSSLTGSLQTFDFTDVASARYVRLVGYGNTSNAWNSYLEVEIHGSAAEAPGNVVNVATAAQLITALANATAGTTIVLANGTYTKSGAFSIQNKNGTASNPITLKAANRGQAIISGDASISVSGSSYVVIEGLKFTNTGASAIVLDGSNNVRVTRNTFDLTENGTEVKWLMLKGSGSHHNRIDHNDFGGKSDPGPVIAMDGNYSTQMTQYDVIEYNYFHDIGPRLANGLETLRMGLSAVSMLDAYATVQYNLFERCDGDPEFISIKSGHNTIRYNTVLNSQGQLTARHGNYNSIYGNFILGDGTKTGVGGIRIYGTDHKVYNNYLEKLTDDALLIDGGDFDGGPNSSSYTSTDLSKHWKVYRAEVVNNTVVNSTTGLVIGKKYTYAPVDSKVANNLIRNTTGTLYNETKTSNTLFQGNIGYGATLNNRSRTSSELRNVNPSLTTSNGLQKLSSTSPAINTAVGTYAYVAEDVDGQIRSTNDVGADEYSTAAIANAPLSLADVGPNAP
ncbi:discoidin domain-containing protein [Archangium violaceum]|uniref:chondroitinase-B domain-containing protein n=1 Tax=Archangium violaceum TaxID=83451 RepID=UPI00194E46FB|nr:chondroitinase-B domain-containing protein [Archangium violaceum]QRO00208.1 discoidin domain-containing protein [Archangium violaceum]